MNSNALPGRGADQVMLRLPDGMRDKLKARAAANRRSMNSEIIVCLEKAVASAAEDEPNVARA
ncbi:Arc family DNA-binding protein [Rhizobium laguerreae]|uniref:Arc family DNA-binding protein n=1 Tax=Rhizobium laguerreae TaxID=1076926 RepID=UPI001C929B30|nr:Arc family DNA-binding protein [Rhizobium laguerreae]MBY3119949.1 Arc family DNA-binding protein [Rhizobium laguerreae]